MLLSHSPGACEGGSSDAAVLGRATERRRSLGCPLWWVSNAFHHGGDTVFFPEVDRCGPG